MNTLQLVVASVMGLMALGLIAAVIWFIKEVFFTPDAPVNPGARSSGSRFGNSAGKAVPFMDQGDYHSGPEGYSPNTAYPDTYYGSGEFEDFNDEEHR
jgi:hypothetical protein